MLNSFKSHLSKASPTENKFTQKDDFSQLAIIFSGLSPQRIAFIQTQFETELKQVLADLAQARSNSNCIQAEQTCHTLKGLSAAYGFSQLSQSAMQTHQACQKNQPDWPDKASQTLEYGEKAYANIDHAFSTITSAIPQAQLA